MIIPNDIFLKELNRTAQELGYEVKMTERGYEVWGKSEIIYVRTSAEQVATWLSFNKLAGNWKD